MHNVRYMRRLSASPLRSMLAIRTLARKYRIASSMISFLSILKARNEISKKEIENKEDMDMNTHTFFCCCCIRVICDIPHTYLPFGVGGAGPRKRVPRGRIGICPTTLTSSLLKRELYAGCKQRQEQTHKKCMHFVQIPVKSKRILTTS